MTAEKNDFGMVNESGTACGGVDQSALAQPSRAEIADKASTARNFAEAAVSAAPGQTLKVGGDVANGEIAIVPPVEEQAVKVNSQNSAAPAALSSSSAAKPIQHEPPVTRWAPGFDTGLGNSRLFRATDSRSKQVINAMYFGLAGLSATSLLGIYASQIPPWAMAWVMPLGMALYVFFIGLALCACYFAWHNRPHESDFKVDLMPHVRRRIRRIGLLLPLPLMLLAGTANLSQYELSVAQDKITDGSFHSAIKHLKIASFLNPLSTEAASRLAFCQMVLDSDRIVAAIQKVRLDPYDGQAFSNLANAYSEVGAYNAALSAAKRHTELHNTEASAFNQIGDIYEKLGQSDEANAAREMANELKQGAESAPGLGSN
jgi:hypothetical protein